MGVDIAVTDYMSNCNYPVQSLTICLTVTTMRVKKGHSTLAHNFAKY